MVVSEGQDQKNPSTRPRPTTYGTAKLLFDACKEAIVVSDGVENQTPHSAIVKSTLDEIATVCTLYSVRRGGGDNRQTNGQADVHGMYRSERISHYSRPPTASFVGVPTLSRCIQIPTMAFFSKSPQQPLCPAFILVLPSLTPIPLVTIPRVMSQDTSRLDFSIPFDTRTRSLGQCFPAYISNQITKDLGMSGQRLSHLPRSCLMRPNLPVGQSPQILNCLCVTTNLHFPLTDA
ncbi:hypothetical protein ACRALDRAFT_2017711 [Sodiomyces alcalophilus JCM 7366]|uniref:uncharacterized protein n=1 Tax=Sodiomyces alcalophilus JCM 7366 TaxID=591952 RepID=UPI0039B3A8BB